MIINLRFFLQRPFPQGCDNFPPCYQSLMPAILALGGYGNDDGSSHFLSGGHILNFMLYDYDSQAAKDVSKLVGGLKLGHLTFGVQQGDGREIIVAKLAKSQQNSRNIELMIREILKLRPAPDGGYLYNPDFGLVKIGRKNDDPGGSLIALNPFGRPELQLDFDVSFMDALADGLKFGGLLALALLLLRRKKGSQDKTGEIKL